MDNYLKEKILSAIETSRDEMVAFIQQLISIPTINPPGKNYKRCVSVIQKKMAEIGINSRLIKVPRRISDCESRDFPRYILMATLGSGEKTFYFHGHYDVVPVIDQSQFHPLVSNGKIYGRGASDMKSGIAAMIYAMKAIKTAGIQLKDKVCLVLVPDEETGGVLGAQYLFESGMIDRKGGVGVLLPEPSSGIIWNANRGAYSLRVRIRGKVSHGCLQFDGINAFENMVAVSNKLLKLKKTVETRRTNFAIRPDSARNSIFMIGGESKGGNNFNTVPGECSFSIDRRTNPEENIETEKKRILSLLNRFKKNGMNLEVDVLQEGSSQAVDENVPLAVILARHIKEVTGKSPRFELCPGLLETRFYIQKGIPGFSYGPGIFSVAHGPDEYANIDDIIDCSAVYALTAVDGLDCLGGR